MHKIFVPAYILMFALVSNVYAEPAALRSDPIKFGATLTLTGASAGFGQACAHGIELAKEAVNAEGGIQGRPLEVLIEDFTESKLQHAVSGAQKLINVDKVIALLPNWSEDAEVIAPIAQARKIISMTLGAGGPGASRYSAASFRATTSDANLAKEAVREQIQKGAKKACVLLADTNYYLDVGEEIARAWKEQGGELSYKDQIPYGSTDVRSYVTRVRAAACESIFIWSSPTTISAIIKELQKQQVKADRVLPWFADAPDVLEAIREDNQHYSLHRWVFKNEDFKQKYKKRYNSDFMRPAGNCYDGVRVLAHVMNKVGTEFDAVRQALLSLKDYEGVTGPFLIDADRERSGELFEKIVLK